MRQQDGDSDCLTMVPGGQTYEVLSESDGWTEVRVDDSMTGYVSSDYVEITFDTVKAVSVEEAEAARIAAEEEAKETAGSSRSCGKTGTGSSK